MGADIKPWNGRVVQLTHDDDGFYGALGCFLSKRHIVKELGAPIWDDDNKVWFVALDDDGIVLGFGCVYDAHGVAMFCSDWVTPENRRKGIHHRLLMERLSACKEYGYEKAAAVVKVSAQRAYQRVGFSVARKISTQFVRMEITLTSQGGGENGA